MTRTVDDLRLSRIDTLWTVVCQAKDPDGAVRAAQQRLLERYGGAVRRYLLGGRLRASAPTANPLPPRASRSCTFRFGPPLRSID